MTTSRAEFFRAVRENPFRGALRQTQVDGLNLLLDTNEQTFHLDNAQLAYVLATAFHETAHTMQPVAEIGRGRGHVYGLPDPQTRQTYYGRGFVQLTWRKRYAFAGEHLNLDLVNHPDLALNPDTAARILFMGMRDGWFTEKKLDNFINPNLKDFERARSIVNGSDCASQIAGYADAFEEALEGHSTI